MTKYTGVIISAFFAIAILGGWMNNIILLYQSDGCSGQVILRAIGILIFPLGAILGFIS